MKEKTEKKEVRKQLLITESLDKRFREHLTEVAQKRKGIISFNKYVAELMERAIGKKDMFLEGEIYFYINFDGCICETSFHETSFDVYRMTLGNIFKTKEEAEAHKDEILAKFEEARKKYVRM